MDYIGFNPRTSIRYDFIAKHICYIQILFQPTYLYKIRPSKAYEVGLYSQVSTHVPL